MYAYALSTPSHRSLVWSSCDMVSGPYRITQYKLMRMYVDISSCECMYIYMSDRLTRTTDEKRGNDVYTNARNPGSQALARCVCVSFCSRPPSTAEGGCLNSLNTLACVPSSLQMRPTALAAARTPAACCRREEALCWACTSAHRVAVAFARRRLISL